MRIDWRGIVAIGIGLTALPAFAGEDVGAKALHDGVAWVPGVYAPPRQPDGNSVLFDAPDGRVVFDSGRHPAHAAAVLAATGGQPVRVVVNSHWHLDHVGGNPALRAAHPGLVVVASPAIDGALQGFLADYAGQLRTALAKEPASAQADDWRAELQRIEAGDALRPDRIVTASGPVVLAGQSFELGFEADAVTGGDLWLLDPASGVLAAGDLVTLPAPFFDTACPARWQAALQRLEHARFTTLVPGHGIPMTREGFARYRRAFDNLLACAAGTATDAACTEGWLADAGPLLADDQARTQARGLLGYYLPAVLRAEDAASRCRAGAG